MGIQLPGRVAVVTGGSRGIGRAIAEGLLDAGAEVIVCSRHDPGPDGLPRSAESSADDGARKQAAFVEADVRKPEDVERLIGEAVSRFGRLDVLVNNAGGSPTVPAVEASRRFFTSVVELNLLAPFFCAQAANSVMQDQVDGGVILMIGSVSGTRPSPARPPTGQRKPDWRT